MKALRSRTRAAILVAAAAGMIAAAPGSNGFACGYDYPQSISRGSLSWSYPNALYVIGAISTEVAARRLPLANFDRPGVDLFGHKLQLAKMSLGQFGTMLGSASPEALRTPVALVLIEPMLWARFVPTAEGLRTEVHVSGAEQGDLVIITGEAVIAEIAAGRLTFGQAYARGVARLYGEDAQIAAFLQKYQQVGTNLSALEPAVPKDPGTLMHDDGEEFFNAKPYSPYAERDLPIRPPFSEPEPSGISTNLSFASRTADRQTERQVAH